MMNRLAVIYFAVIVFSNLAFGLTCEVVFQGKTQIGKHKVSIGESVRIINHESGEEWSVIYLGKTERLMNQHPIA